MMITYVMTLSIPVYVIVFLVSVILLSAIVFHFWKNRKRIKLYGIEHWFEVCAIMLEIPLIVLLMVSVYYMVVDNG